MKLTTEQANIIRNTKSFTSEGFVQRMFAKLLKRKLSKDTDFKRAVDNADKSALKLQKAIKKAEKQGIEIPAGLKQYAGL
tara:strand:+ start:133 stop:372 length:240 start_codon:yes stop_codon:yes gene_type:complete